VFSVHIVLTRAHPGRTSRSVTHPQISPGQARLTSEFFGDQLPEKKLQLIGMNILLILLSPGPGCHTYTEQQKFLWGEKQSRASQQSRAAAWRRRQRRRLYEGVLHE